MKTHIIENGVVTNTILATVEEAQQAFQDAVCIDGEIGGIGWTWDGTTLVAPQIEVLPPSVPQVVTIRQAKLALLVAGLLDDVDAAVAQASRAVQIEWEYATEIRRDWPTLITLQSALGLTDAQVDELFVQAASL